MTNGTHDTAALRVDAHPTKDFFVSMLVRDVDLLDAVIDLLDNSVDGARRLRDSQDYSGLRVQMTFDANSFTMDNCGGIPLDVAQLCISIRPRPEESTIDPHSIGQFGVGMKRTLFKLGQEFKIASNDGESEFFLDVNVPEWLDSPEWDFEIVTDTEDPIAGRLDSAGTIIEVTNLAQSAADSLTDPSWAKRLGAAARLKHRRAIDRGLQISVNDVVLAPMPLDLRSGEGLEPAIERLRLLGGDVSVTLLAGLSEPDPSAAGWYVFCNDRLVLGPDRTAATVWRGAGRQARGGVPNYHDQYSEFRGYALFQADNPSLLPWTTTKTGVDTDNPVWRATRPQMERLTRPIIDFLNQLDKERTAVQGDGRRGQTGLVNEDDGRRGALASAAVVETPRVRIDELIPDSDDAIARDFQSPNVDLNSLPTPKVWIRYAAEASEVSQARRLMGGTSVRDLSNGDVGRRTFDYYLDNEGD